MVQQLIEGIIMKNIFLLTLLVFVFQLQAATVIRDDIRLGNTGTLTGSIHVPYGLSITNDSAIHVSAIRSDAANLNAAGLYFMTYINGIGGEQPLSGTVTNITYTYDATSSKINYEIDYTGFNSCGPFSKCGQYAAFAWNFDEDGIDANIDSWGIDEESREIFVNTNVAVNRIDIHGFAGGDNFNYELTLASSNNGVYTYTMFIPTTVEQSDVLDCFFNYTLNGLGINTQQFVTDFSDILPTYTQNYWSYSQGFSFADYNFNGVSAAYVHYKINGGPMMNYAMNAPVIPYALEYTIQEELVNGDVVDYYFTYTFNGVAYDTPWFTAVQYQP